ncbi:MAG: hypothetical protein RL660_3172 [Bacteroidota bacterium]|jgi:UPF0176 protein
MAQLHNKISHEELRAKMAQDDTPRTTISFYKYFKISDPKLFRDDLYRQFSQLGVLGRVYVANEGINAQVSMPTANVEAFRQCINAIQDLEGIRLNVAVDDDGKSFFVLKVKVRDKIVADGISDESFDASKTGKYLKADEYNTLVKQQDTIVVDMRNHYEYEVGHFKNAIEVPSDTFREQLPMAVDMLKDKKDANIIMYCTGGIRCEKASAYMLHHGFSNVYHVEGGIINYAQQVKERGLESEFIGKNFVFDERLGERITHDIISSCHQCGQPADTHTNCANEACHLLFIQCEACAKTMQGCCTSECVEELSLPKEARKERRKGLQNGAKIFNKSKDARLGLRRE